MTFQDPNTTNVYQQPYEVSQTMNPKLYHCYDFKLKCKSKKKKPCIGLIQENSIEFLV